MLLGKKKVRGPNIKLIALFEIHFRYLFLGVKKRRQCSEVPTIARDLLHQLYSGEMLLGRNENEIWNRLMINQ